MGNIKKKSLRQHCISITGKIKKQKENRHQSSPPAIPHSTFTTIRHSLNELDFIQTARLRSYSNWPHFIPSGKIMSSNGWFYCNVNDRVICIYCKKICHKWTNTDDPYEVHARLAPECPFVLSITSSSSSNKAPPLITHNLSEKFQPRHTTMCEINQREKSFDNNTWTQTSPSVNDLIKAGFFYSGIGNTVTCFYCGGSLHKWGTNDNPKIEHARWFPNCLYAKHLCGDQLHAKIQIKKKRVTIEKHNIDKETIMRLVNARLDLPIAQRLRTQYSYSIVRRCFEEQWKINHDDFSSDNDLIMACFILQKQIDACQENSNKLIIPSQNQMSISSLKTSKTKLEECIICVTEERQLACMPCGHLCTCVICGYALHSCPICRQQIESFVRIYC
ncbi:unnamed protein product [Rotaria sp. Silwood2]|nr:unnamed protein product [Rotaria sp. Silwood2]CAF2808688.1 unnamed protein product [Rotaria sp. Silwood2]CAF3340659.1 unnamed protein product [Rotaria sp. Silwood2]CAF4014209.1 unnamed protein product [Rotaria sp. Silwood2]CAF4298582.1 unnamed protein product [Rotaria sp. Silwood2]